MLVADTGLSRHRRRSAKACLLVDTQAFSRPGPSGRGRRRARAPRGNVGTATRRTPGAVPRSSWGGASAGAAPSAPQGPPACPCRVPRSPGSHPGPLTVGASPR